uniref:Uncharacterized protein n=1 Tax=Glossina brevipalpis TaxID=37001 RepID=A0A1A9WMU4_9MUSC
MNRKYLKNFFFLILLIFDFSLSKAFIYRLITEALENNVAGEPITHQKTTWDFDPEISKRRRALFYETHGFRAAKFIERIGLGTDGQEEKRRSEQQLRDEGKLNGEHFIISDTIK